MLNDLLDGVEMLTDKKCDEFRRLPMSFNDMVREIFKSGFRAGDAAQDGAQIGQSDSTGGLGALPDHAAALFLTHNEHKNYYEDAGAWIEEQQDIFEWESEEHKRRAIEADSVWVLQWYPNTPVGFNSVAAPTLEELIAFANDYT